MTPKIITNAHDLITTVCDNNPGAVAEFLERNGYITGDIEITVEQLCAYAINAYNRNSNKPAFLQTFLKNIPVIRQSK